MKPRRNNSNEITKISLFPILPSAMKLMAVF